MPIKLRALRDGAIVAGWLFLGYLFLVVAPQTGTFGFDAFAYWNVTMPSVYDIPVGDLGAFTYSPPMALLADTFSVLAWPTFLLIWTMLLIGTVIWLGARPLWILAAFAFPPVALELYHGNIQVLLAAAIVLGFAHPWTWSLVLLTKPSMGVGLLWFAARGEWRSLGTALGVTATLMLASWLVAPWLWTEYIGFLLQSATGASSSPVLLPLPLWLRLPVAALVVLWGARTDRAWTIAVAAWLAMPVIWFASAAVLLAVVPSLRERWPRERRDPVSVPSAAHSPAVGA